MSDKFRRKLIMSSKCFGSGDRHFEAVLQMGLKCLPGAS